MPQTPAIYLNHADVAEMKSLDAIGSHASAIVENRPYADWSDLKRAGLSQEAINSLKSEGARLGDPGEGPIGEPGSGGSGGAGAGNFGRA